ncbi:multidrug effflux MFS transporter [Sphingomonas quercus]|uniref:Bcr/CflA family efflux transporter n=1 Tax=Sphingomonas quercus TaxID=2842451 RepID=A0ABS6BG61_9SPHN|nr:multidrug effflux MFS transporter [Sphingomonas quercus]MBU3077278.1 multidrug effflux MFS transporter [Sphingomonas quercus]
MSASPPANSPHPGLSFRAFVAMVACMMMLNALAIDSMLPALAAIGDSLGVTHENDRQWVITAYLLGFGVAQLVHGTLSDRFGRRPVLIGGLAAYVLFSVVITVSGSFTMLIIARGLQGVGAAASRVVAVSVVRDCYSGRPMARVMSLAFIVFLVVPILAPSVGTLVLMVGPWRWIFGLLGVLGALILTWTALKLPETLHPEFRRSIDPRAIAAAWARVVRDRMSVGYTLAMTLLSGGLFGFINSVEQITADTFHRPHALPVVFATIGSCMAVGSFLNSRIVERLGTRRVSHTALIGLLGCGAVHLLVAATGHETLASFAILQALTMFCFSLCGANFGAMAMENLGSVAGAAASLQGFASTVGGALAGFAIGQQFDGTTVPVAAGFTVFAIVALGIVAATERGKLFRAHHQPPAPAA